MAREKLAGLGVGRKDASWLAAAGVGLALCLMLNGMYGSAVMGRVASETFGGVITDDPLSGGASAVAACAVAALALAARRREPRFSAPAAAALAVALAAPLAVMLASGSQGAGRAAGLVLGAAAVLLLGFWVQALARAGRARAFVALALGLAVDVALDVFVSVALVEAASGAALLAIAAAAPFALLLFERMDGPCRAGGAATGASSGEARLKAAEGRRAALPGFALARSAYDVPFWLALAFIAVESFAMGHVQAVGSDIEFAGARGWAYENAARIVVALAALFCLACARMREPHASMRAAILVVLMYTVYLSTSVGPQMEPLGRLAMTAVRLLITLYIWLLACDIPWRNGWPMFAFVSGWGTFTLVNTVSTRIGFALEPGTPGRLAYDLAVVTCLAALALMELAARRAYAGGLAGVPGAESAPGNAGQEDGGPAQDPLLASCQALAGRYGLTSRELEVLVPLVHGRSAATIAQALGMSTETARTHIRHIYSKTDIHNREDLIDEVEGLAASEEAA